MRDSNFLLKLHNPDFHCLHLRIFIFHASKEKLNKLRALSFSLHELQKSFHNTPSTTHQVCESNCLLSGTNF